MNNIVIFGATQSGKTTLLGYLSTGMLRNPQFNEEVFEKLKLIRKLTITDEFKIGDPTQPEHIRKSVILPSFVSLDRDELRKFKNTSTEGTSKRIHRKQLIICISEQNLTKNTQNENTNVACTFVDLPGFRQRFSDKYRGFFDGNIGIAVLKLQEVLELVQCTSDSRQKSMKRRLFDPIRIWCDYRSPSRLVIALSQIDRNLSKDLSKPEAIQQQVSNIKKAIECIRENLEKFSKGVYIPISPISIQLTSERNYKPNSRMSVFFRRNAENIYSEPKDKALPGDGTLITCIKKNLQIISEIEKNRIFSLASVYKPMKVDVSHTKKTALGIRALHGTIQKNNSVILGPVKNKYDQIIYTKCTVESLKADGSEEPSDVLLEGNVGGIIFKSMYSEELKHSLALNYIKPKSDVKILKSTILFSGEYIQGDIISLEIYAEDHLNINGQADEIYGEILPSIMPFDSLFLFWYGKKITVQVTEIVYSRKKVLLSVIISKNELTVAPHFALPCNKHNKPLYDDNVLLAIPELCYTVNSKKNAQPLYTYVSAHILELKCSNIFSAVKIEASDYMYMDAILKEYVHFNRQKMLETDMSSFYIPIKHKTKQIDIYSVLTKIGRNMRKTIDRLYYRQLDGVKMELSQE